MSGAEDESDENEEDDDESSDSGNIIITLGKSNLEISVLPDLKICCHFGQLLNILGTKISFGLLHNLASWSFEISFFNE